MRRGVGRPRLNNRPTYCIYCDKVHCHSDGAIFCKVRAFRVTEETRRPQGCVSGTRRTGKIPKIMREYAKNE